MEVPLPWAGPKETPMHQMRAEFETGSVGSDRATVLWHVVGRETGTALCGRQLDAGAEAVPGHDAEDDTDRYCASCMAAVYRLRTPDGAEAQ
jgi:hypothetical protein